MHVAGRVDLADALYQVRGAAAGVADYGDQAEGRALVDHESPRLVVTRQGEHVAAGIPPRHLRLVDEAQAAHGEPPLVAAHFSAERPIAEQQQVERRLAALDSADHVQWPLPLDELAGEDDRWLSRVQSQRPQPPGARRPGSLGHAAEAVVVHAVGRVVLGYAPVALVEGGIVLPDRQRARGSPDNGDRKSTRLNSSHT